MTRGVDTRVFLAVCSVFKIHAFLLCWCWLWCLRGTHSKWPQVFMNVTGSFESMQMFRRLLLSTIHHPRFETCNWWRDLFALWFCPSVCPGWEGRWYFLLQCRLVWDFIYCSCPNLPLPSVYTRRPDAKISTPALPGPSKVVFFCGRGARVKNCARLTRGHKFFNGRGWSTVTMAGQCSGLYSPPIITRPNLRYCPCENADGRANEAAAETKLKHGQDSWKICYVSTWTSRDVCILHCRVWHSWKSLYEWMSEYIRINKITRMNIRIYSY